jgi:ketosteroid isomerase-like protein
MGRESRCQVARSPLEIARTCLQAIERGATGAELAAFYTDDVVQEEFPNRLAMFIEFRGEKIARQRNYDCYEPF